MVTKKVNTDFFEFCEAIVHFFHVCRASSKREGGSENLRQHCMQTRDALDGLYYFSLRILPALKGLDEIDYVTTVRVLYCFYKIFLKNKR